MSTANRQLPRNLTKGEIKALLEAARASGIRDTMLVAVVLDTGLSLQEVASLRASSIKVDRLLVEGETGRRWTPVSEPMAAELEAIAKGGDVIWQDKNGQPMTVDALRRVLARLFDQAGIKDRGPAEQILRDTFAVRYIWAGGSFVDLQYIMGCANITADMRFLHAPHRQMWEKHQDLSPLLWLDDGP